MSAEARVAHAETLVQQRLEAFDYLQRVHESDARGGTFWLNTVLLDRRDLDNLYDTHRMAERAHAFLLLGMGLGKLLSAGGGALPGPDSGSGGSGCGSGSSSSSSGSSSSSSGSSSSSSSSLAQLLRDALQLLEELEYYVAANAVQSVRLLLAGKGAPFPPSRAARRAEQEAEQERRRQDDPAALPAGLPTVYAHLPPPALRKSGGAVVFEQLWAVAVAHRLDYVQVLLTLCRTLSLTYARLRDCLRAELRASGGVADMGALAALTKLDGRIKHHVLNPIAKELTDYCELKMAQELEALLASSSGGADAPQAAATSATSPGVARV